MRRRVIIGDAFDLSVTVETTSPEPEKKAKTSSRRKVVVGQEFDAKATLEAPDAKDADTRAKIVWTVFAICAAFLAGSSAWGIYQGEFSGLQAIWGVVGPIYGGIAGYFFPHRKK